MRHEKSAPRLRRENEWKRRGCRNFRTNQTGPCFLWLPSFVAWRVVASNQALPIPLIKCIQSLYSCWCIMSYMLLLVIYYGCIGSAICYC
uniref:Uncharacterized protein n=1 Tax=Arundo donax TaxID=35708 RepID=A0A0A9FF59_ARUDO